jgi:hypothetical protein
MFDMLSTGMCIFAQCVIISNLKVMILAYVQSPGLYLICLSSILFFYLSSFLAEKLFYYGDLVNVFYNSTTVLGYWACIGANTSLIMIYEQIRKAMEETKHMEEEVNEIEMSEMMKPMLKESDSN